MQRSADGDAALFTVALSSPGQRDEREQRRGDSGPPGRHDGGQQGARRAARGCHRGRGGDRRQRQRETLSGLLLCSAIVIVLVFGVASDYALLLVHRYREELRHHAACEEAMAAALRAVLPTLAASAATVTGDMLCLLAAESGSLHGLGSMGAVAVAFLAGTTFLPALLLILGRAAFWPRIPATGAPGAETSSAWAAIGAREAAAGRGSAQHCPRARPGLRGADVAADQQRPPERPQGTSRQHRRGATPGGALPAGAIAPLVLLAPRCEAETAAHLARNTVGVATVTLTLRSAATPRIPSCCPSLPITRAGTRIPADTPLRMPTAPGRPPRSASSRP